MISRLSPRFKKAFQKLPNPIQNQAKNTYKLWKDNPHHPSLQFKKIHSNKPIYSVRIGRDWRAFGLLKDNSIIWFWIGSHETYNQLIKKL